VKITKFCLRTVGLASMQSTMFMILEESVLGHCILETSIVDYLCCAPELRQLRILERKWSNGSRSLCSYCLFTAELYPAIFA